MKKKVLIFGDYEASIISACKFFFSLEEKERPELIFEAFVPEALKWINGGTLSGVIADNVDVVDACHDHRIPCLLSVSPGDVGDSIINARLEEISSLLGIEGFAASRRDWPKLWRELLLKME